MAEPVGIILPPLRVMRAETARHVAGTAACLDEIEATQLSFRHALGSDSRLSKLVAGDARERIEAVGKRVQGEEKRAS